jgi:hypothetical protein
LKAFWVSGEKRSSCAAGFFFFTPGRYSKTKAYGQVFDQTRDEDQTRACGADPSKPLPGRGARASAPAGLSLPRSPPRPGSGRRGLFHLVTGRGGVASLPLPPIQSRRLPPAFPRIRRFDARPCPKLRGGLPRSDGAIKNSPCPAKPSGWGPGLRGGSGRQRRAAPPPQVSLSSASALRPLSLSSLATL